MFGNIIAGLLGASLGGRLFGSFGPSFGGIHVVPALLGAIVLIFIVSFVVAQRNRYIDYDEEP